MSIGKQVLLPYNRFTRGGKALASALGIPFRDKNQLQIDFSVAVSKDETVSGKTLINWGSTAYPKWMNRDWFSTVYNLPSRVATCSDKLRFFDAVKGKVSIPEYTKELEEARKWQDSGIEVMGRQTKGSCGRDIKFFSEDLQKFVDSDFWVQYKKKKDEYRVHVAFDNVLSVQRKALRKTDPLTGAAIDTSEVDFRVRNLRNGFVFIRNDVNPPDTVLEQSLLAMAAVGLDYGAVDVIWNESERKAYVLEINTAPGLEGSTVTEYAKAIKEKVCPTDVV